MTKIILSFFCVILLIFNTFSQHFTYSDHWSDPGFTLLEAAPGRVVMHYSIAEWSMSDISVNRENLKKIDLPGHFLPNDEGAPDLPGSGRYIAMPQGAAPRLEIIAMQTETYYGIDLAPAFRIPKTTEDGPLFYAKNQDIYSADSFYPENPIVLSAPDQIRGLDVVMLGITPFQYNPVTKELVVYRNIELEVVFEGGNGHYGENRLRSRWWDPLLKDAVVNGEVIGGQRPVLKTKSEGSAVGGQRSAVGYEYLIICPDDPVFTAWADTIRVFRNRQGISTGVVTTAEIGGNNAVLIENYINNAYLTWDIPPAAVLILGDHGASGSTVIAPIWNSYCASDNIYADVTGNHLPDIVFARMTAQNATHLETMIRKFIDHETDPPTDSDFYHHPITALGWQTERWFQICIEVVGGFFRNELGKDPVRVNEIYGGNPSVDPWSTAPNTSTIMNYFGPNGLGYIPSSPNALGNWDGGTATHINNAINSGSFLLLHRDHGYELGWGEPSYSNSSMNGLNNDDLPFVYSVNCLTGKYNYSGECFAEAFHRRPKRALGIIAASEVSYSFVNDTYVWGAFDNMWPEFMPAYGSTPEPRGLLPAFSNAAGKIFLQQSNWPYNTNSKVVTYHLFHHHGDAFSSLYSEVPQDLLVMHDGVMVGGATSYTVQADTNSLIALSVDGEIIGVADGTGEPVQIEIIAQMPGATVDLVVTKRNHFRYETTIPVISPNAPYVIYQEYEINDDNGNGNGLMDYAEEPLLSLTVTNIGTVDAEDVTVTLSTTDPYVLITDSTEYAGTIPANSSVTLTDGFAFTVADSIPDAHKVFFLVDAASDDTTFWTSQFYITAHAPVLDFTGYLIVDTDGNNNGRIDPGETVEIYVTIHNAGTSQAFQKTTELSCDNDLLTVLTPPQVVDTLHPDEIYEAVFTVTADESTLGGISVDFTVDITADYGRSGQGAFSTIIGQYAALVLDLDPGNYSGPHIYQAFENIDLAAHYQTDFPDDLGLYKSIFMCLGIYYSNHVLQEYEAQLLKDYLDNGGKIYMEGHSTWYHDPQTSLHPMFSLTTEYINWYAYDKVYSIPGTFTEGMLFDVNSILALNNYVLVATAPAYELFTLKPEGLHGMVAHDEGSYKTVASSFEIGGLADGDHPSTKTELVNRILLFFGDISTGLSNDGNILTNAPSLVVYPNPFRDRVLFNLSLPETVPVKLEIYDLTGRLIATLTDEMLSAGNHLIQWAPAGYTMTNGIYFYRFIAGNQMKGGKLFLAR